MLDDLLIPNFCKKKNFLKKILEIKEEGLNLYI